MQYDLPTCSSVLEVYKQVSYENILLLPCLVYAAKVYRTCHCSAQSLKQILETNIGHMRMKTATTVANDKLCMGACMKMLQGRVDDKNERKRNQESTAKHHRGHVVRNKRIRQQMWEHQGIIRLPKPIYQSLAPI